MSGVGIVTRAPLAGEAASDELAQALGQALAGSPIAVTLVERRPIPYRSTFPLDELVVRVAGGPTERLVFKDLSRDGLGSPAWRVKAPFLHHPLREIETYRDVLAPHELSAPRFRAAVIDPARGRQWLFLEHVEGDPLWQRGEDAIWKQAAAWLADMHARFVGRRDDLPQSLLVYDGAFYRRWLARAREFVRWPVRAGGRVRDFNWLATRTSKVVEWLAGQPTTFVHGEFYPSNVLIEPEGLVEPAGVGPRIRPVDWEMAGIGSGLLDLAALTSGVWSEMDREMMMQAYRSALPEDLRPAEDELREGLRRCRLLLAVQWLGWSSEWTPPAEQAHDWLATALELAAEVPA
ncbi:MAG: phosphotransferase [Thermoanaerobaculia bacterium]